MDHNIAAKTVAHVYTPGLEQRDGLGGALHLFGVDAIGSVRALINDDGGEAVTDTQGYFAYGITRSRTGTDWMAFGFAGAEGYQTDPNELMLLGNREYHPFTGRFLTRDPAHAGSNDYEYCNNNPLGFADPTGLDGVPLGESGFFSGPRGSNPAGEGLQTTDLYLNQYINGVYKQSWYLGSFDTGYLLLNPWNGLALDVNPNHWQIHIRATSFSGRGDPEHSAYPPYNRINPNALGAALPAHHLKGLLIQVMNAMTGQSAIVPIVDVGPIFGDSLPDNSYWETDSRPAAEDPSMHPDYFPKSTAGLDLTPASLAAIGLPSGSTGGGYVDWRFAQ